MNPLMRWLHWLGAPPNFHAFAARWAPWFYLLALPALAWGIWQGLFVVPSDYEQGDSYRILFVHVPSAWLSLSTYVVMAIYAVIALIWRIKLVEVLAMCCAPIGALFTLVTLLTGAIWGKPMWGTWWTWDARLTSELVLLFIYLGVIGLYAAIEDRREAARVACFLVLIGLVNVPIVHFSVEWWNSLHQGATIRLFRESTMDSSMLPPLIAMFFGTKLWFAGSLLKRAQATMYELEAGKDWVRRDLESQR